MKRVCLLALLAVLMLPAMGCFQNTVVVSPDYDPRMTAPTHQETRMHILGLVPIGGDINLNEYCPQGTGIVETKMLFPFFVVSFGQMSIYCGTERAELVDQEKMESVEL